MEPAEGGKTYTLHLVMEIFNMWRQDTGCLDDAYVFGAKTGKDVVEVGGVTTFGNKHPASRGHRLPYAGTPSLA